MNEMMFRKPLRQCLQPIKRAVSSYDSLEGNQSCSVKPAASECGCDLCLRPPSTTSFPGCVSGGLLPLLSCLLLHIHSDIQDLCWRWSEDSGRWSQHVRERQMLCSLYVNTLLMCVLPLLFRPQQCPSPCLPSLTPAQVLTTDFLTTAHPVIKWSRLPSDHPFER